MRLGLVGWVADSGVGRELIDALRHLPVSALFMLQNPGKPTRQDLVPKNIPVHVSSPSGADLIPQMAHFLERTGIDTVLTWEVPGCWEFPKLWATKKVRWVNVIHWDWFSPDQGHAWSLASALVAPNRMCQAELLSRYNLKSTLLSVPVDTERLPFKERRFADLFLSTYGYGGFHNRRSLPEILAAWKAMKSPPSLMVRAQVPPGELLQIALPRNVIVELGNAPEPADLYEIGDIAVQPSRYEGLGLSMLEAQSCGIPVLTVNGPPMNEIAAELLVPCSQVASISVMGKTIAAYTPSAEGIQKVIEGIQGKDIRELSRGVRAKVERYYSWRALLPSWLSLLKGR